MDIYRAAVGLINTTEGIIFLPICVRAPKDDTPAAPEKQVSVKLGSECRTKCHSANKTAVVFSVISYKNKSTFLQWMFKIGENQGVSSMKTLRSVYQASYLNQGRGKLGRNTLAGVIQCLETNAQSLIGDLNGLMKLGVEERFQL